MIPEGSNWYPGDQMVPEGIKMVPKGIKIVPEGIKMILVP